MLYAISGRGTAILLAVARKMTLEHRGKAMRGGDPLADRRKAAAALTFEQAVEHDLANKLDEFRNEKHRKQWRSKPATWTIPAARLKSVHEHRVSLTPPAMAILRVLPWMKDSPYVFLPPLGGMLSDMSISAVVRRMQECEEKTCRAGFMNPRSKRAAVPHGLPSTFRQLAA